MKLVKLGYFATGFGILRTCGPMADRARRVSTPLPAPVRQTVLVSASAFALGCSAHALRALGCRS